MIFKRLNFTEIFYFLYKLESSQLLGDLGAFSLTITKLTPKLLTTHSLIPKQILISISVLCKKNFYFIFLTNLSALRSSIPLFFKVFLVNEFTGAPLTIQNISKHEKIIKKFIFKAQIFLFILFPQLITKLTRLNLNE